MCILSYSVRRPSQTTRGNISIIQMVSKNRYITLWKTWIHARLDRWATMLCHVTPSIPPRVPCHVSLSLGGFRLAFLRPLCPSIHFCVKNHVTFFRMNWKEKRRAALPYQQVSDVVSVVFFFCIACISKLSNVIQVSHMMERSKLVVLLTKIQTGRAIGCNYFFLNP